jgi:hypothetical protein
MDLLRPIASLLRSALSQTCLPALDGMRSRKSCPEFPNERFCLFETTAYFR